MKQCREGLSEIDDPFRASNPTPGETPCRCCGGTGEVSGVVDDIEFTFQCPCAGGLAEPVRWLLGEEWEATPGDDPSI